VSSSPSRRGVAEVVSVAGGELADTALDFVS
jgi:hypothetical protein